jgi:hypothetical protein
MRWVLRTKVVDDPLVVIISSLALLYQALDLDNFRGDGHDQRYCTVTLSIRICSICDSSQQVSYWDWGPGQIRRGWGNVSSATNSVALLEASGAGQAERDKKKKKWSSQRDPCLIVICIPVREVTACRFSTVLHRPAHIRSIQVLQRYRRAGRVVWAGIHCI